MKNRTSFLTVFLSAVLFILLLSGCDNSTTPPTEPEVRERGFVFSAQKTATFTPEQIGQILDFYGLEHDLQFLYTVNVYKMEYQTVTAGETPVHASGALMIPVTTGAAPLLSIQHGTVTGRYEVASTNALSSVEGIVGLITASLGYVTNVPDYTGFGVSTLLHPYVHAQSLAWPVIDMLRATRTYIPKTNLTLAEEIYLAGYSEGGYATLATQKEIEENYSGEFQLTAVAPMAGPYDLLSTFALILEQETYSQPGYIAFLITAYDALYGWNRLDEIFQAPYAAMMPGFFDGSKSYGTINQQLPMTLRALLKPEFIDAYLAGTETAVLDAVEENTLLDWSPATPILFFHGDADEAVPYINAVNAVENLSSLTDVSIGLVTIPGGTHESAGMPAILGMIEWIQQIQSSKSRIPVPGLEFTYR